MVHRLQYLQLNEKRKVLSRVFVYLGGWADIVRQYYKNSGRVESEDEKKNLPY